MDGGPAILAAVYVGLLSFPKQNLDTFVRGLFDQYCWHTFLEKESEAYENTLACLSVHAPPLITFEPISRSVFHWKGGHTTQGDLDSEHFIFVYLQTFQNVVR
jgi:hypothetical protein